MFWQLSTWLVGHWSNWWYMKRGKEECLLFNRTRQGLHGVTMHWHVFGWSWLPIILHNLGLSRKNKLKVLVYPSLLWAIVLVAAHALARQVTPCKMLRCHPFVSYMLLNSYKHMRSKPTQKERSRKVSERRAMHCRSWIFQKLSAFGEESTNRFTSAATGFTKSHFGNVWSGKLFLIPGSEAATYKECCRTEIHLPETVLQRCELRQCRQ